MSQSILGTGFRYDTEIIKPDGRVIADVDFNLLPQVSIDHIAGLIRGTASPIGSWYVGLFEGNYVPTSGVTSADLPATAVECTAYSESARPAWTNAYDGVSVIDSLAAKATFTLTIAKRVYGAFLVSAATKGGNTGLILSIARFASPKDIDAGEVFTVAAGLTLIPTSL
ncbi:hypothetical protein D3C75_711330 [compost metagenome]